MVFDVRQVVTLPRRELMPMQLAAGATVHCTSGRLWISEHGVWRDVVLEQGDAYEARSEGDVIVQALCDAEFFVRAVQASPAIPIARRPILGVMARIFGFARGAALPAVAA